MTKSDAGVYSGKLDSLDQGATIPIDTITVNGDAVRLEIKSPAIVFEGTLNKERTELTGTFNQGDQKIPLTLKRSEQATATPTPTPKPKPDYSAPADAPYTAEEVLVKTPAGHTLAGTLTLPKSASRTKPVSAIVTVTGSGPQDRDENIGLPGLSALPPDRRFAGAPREFAVLRWTTGNRRLVARSKARQRRLRRDVRAGLAFCARGQSPGRSPRRARHSEVRSLRRWCVKRSPRCASSCCSPASRSPGRTALHFSAQKHRRARPKLTPSRA